MNIKQLVNTIRWEAKIAYKRCKFRGVFNYFLSLIDTTLYLPFCVAKPTVLHVTIVEGICNFSCKMCSPMPPDHKKEISFENFKKIFDVCKYVYRLNLGAWGEPFMVKDIFKIISYAKAQNCEVETTTNMSLINEAVAKDIIKSQLDYLFISFDAAEPEIFERIRQGAKFQTILNNIKTLNRLKAEYRSENPKLSLKVTALKENIYEIPKIIELAHQLGIKEVKINPLRIFGTGLAIEEQSLTNFPELRQRMFSIAATKAKELGMTFICPDYRRHYRREISACKQPWRTLSTRMDGTIEPCCAYYPALGNMFKDDIKDIWNNRNFRLIRKVVRRESSICYYCLPVLNELRLEC